MKQHIGKKCFIKILTKDNKELYYTGTVIALTKNHISFIDKYGKGWSYLIEDVKEIEEKPNE